jgi:hypothetical protein
MNIDSNKINKNIQGTNVRQLSKIDIFYQVNKIS